MDPFRLPRIPGLSDLVSLLQTQTEALASLPRTLADLSGAVGELIAATRTATAAITSAQRTAERLEALVEELEEPVRALRPGLMRVGKVLDDPVVDTLPETLRRLSDDLLPIVSGLRSAQTRVEAVTGVLRNRRGGEKRA